MKEGDSREMITAISGPPLGPGPFCLSTEQTWDCVAQPCCCQFPSASINHECVFLEIGKGGKKKAPEDFVRLVSDFA